MSARRFASARRLPILVIALGLLLIAGVASAQVLLDPLSLTKYVDPLPVPGAMPTAGPNYYEIGVWQIQQQLHSQLPPTTPFSGGSPAYCRIVRSRLGSRAMRESTLGRP